MIKKSVGIITPPIGEAGIQPLSNLVDVISSISDSTFVITGDIEINTLIEHDSKIEMHKIHYLDKSNIISKIINHVVIQLKMSFFLYKLSKNVDVWIFFLDSHALLLPLVAAKIFKKKIIILLAASIRFSEAQNNSFTKIRLIEERTGFHVADKIIVYSEILVSKWELTSYLKKIVVAHRHFLNFNAFTASTTLSERPILIGYIGRLSKEKGIQNFYHAIPEIIHRRTDIQVLIGGDGPLRESMEIFLESVNLQDYIKFPGWICYKDLPIYLNQLQLLVIPSYTEGLPNIMLEAMACGTPVLSTPVGAIPDVIKDNETGFIMAENSPECITENVIRAMSTSKLEQIADKGRRFVEDKYTFENVVKEWNKILQDI